MSSTNVHLKSSISHEDLKTDVLSGFFKVVTVGQDLRRAFFLHCTSIFQQFLDVLSLKSILLIYI